MRTVLNISIKTLSPVHVGCGEAYELGDFAYNSQSKVLHIIDSLSFVRSLTRERREEFNKLCSGADTGALFSVLKFVQCHAGNLAETRRVIPLAPGVAEYIEKTLALAEEDFKKQLKNFEFQRTVYCAEDFRPYIPGSSLKGAIRTAVLNANAKQEGVQMGPAETKDEQKIRVNKAKSLEARLLAKSERGEEATASDPFRLLHVSDFLPVGDVKTRIVFARNFKKEKNEKADRRPSTLFQLLEVIEPETCFIGTLTIDEPICHASGRSVIAAPLTQDFVFRALKDFFEKERERENGDLEKGSLERFNPNVSPGAWLVRLGHHSGAECVTIDGCRSIAIKQKKNSPVKFLESATTIWLACNSKEDAQGAMPFGWVELSILDKERYEGLICKERVWKEEVFQRELKAKQAKEMEEKRRLEEEKLRKQKEAEEARRKAEWDKLPQDEKDLARLSDPDVGEQEVVEILKRLDENRAEKRFELALAIKQYYQRKGKWEGRLNDKQAAKVAKLKSILGEAA